MTATVLVATFTMHPHSDLGIPDTDYRWTWPCGRLRTFSRCGSLSHPCDCPHETRHTLPEAEYHGPC